MVRIKTKNSKYATKELNSSVSVFLDLTEPKRNETTEIPKFTKIVLFRSSTGCSIPFCEVISSSIKLLFLKSDKYYSDIPFWLVVHIVIVLHTSSIFLPQSKLSTPFLFPGSKLFKTHRSFPIFFHGIIIFFSRLIFVFSTPCTTALFKYMMLK